MTANLVSFFQPLCILLGLLAFFLSLSQGVGIIDSVFRTLIVYAAAMILALLGYNIYLNLAFKVSAKIAEEEQRRIEKEKSEKEKMEKEAAIRKSNP